MAKGSDLDRVTAIVLREMRPPLAVLLVVYALGIGVMVLIPGMLVLLACLVVLFAPFIVRGYYGGFASI